MTFGTVTPKLNFGSGKIEITSLAYRYPNEQQKAADDSLSEVLQQGLDIVRITTSKPGISVEREQDKEPSLIYEASTQRVNLKETPFSQDVALLRFLVSFVQKLNQRYCSLVGAPSHRESYPVSVVYTPSTGKGLTDPDLSDVPHGFYTEHLPAEIVEGFGNLMIDSDVNQ